MPRTIELRSGTWSWGVEEDEAEVWGAGGPLARTVVLRAVDNPADRMVVRVPPHLGGPGDEAVVAAAAIHPERRFVEDDDGEVWAVWPVSHDPDVAESLVGDVTPPREVRATRDENGAKATVLPPGRELGQLTREELLDLIR